MLSTYAKILGNHTADVIERTSDLVPDQIDLRHQPEVLPTCELAVRIDFKGALTDNEKVNGYVMCGSVKKDDSLPLIASMSRHLGLDDEVVNTADGPINILSEFLNIVIGLTGADWSEHGFDMKFSIPRDLSGQPLPPLSPSDEAFHITVTTVAGNRVDVMAIFSV